MKLRLTNPFIYHFLIGEFRFKLIINSTKITTVAPGEHRLLRIYMLKISNLLQCYIHHTYLNPNNLLFVYISF